MKYTEKHRTKAVNLLTKTIEENIRLYNHLYPNLGLTMVDVINHLINKQKEL